MRFELESFTLSTMGAGSNGRLVTERDHVLAGVIADEAGRLLLDLRMSGLPPDELRAAGDRRSHDHIVARLAEAFPDDAWLSEEAPPSDARLSAPRVWVVDPLDGTREFGEDGRPDWAIHVALVVGGEACVGAVALPAAGVTLTTHRPPRAQRPPRERLRIVVSRTRPAAFAVELVERLDGELVSLGSAGAKIAAVIRGEVDVYVHAGGQYEWDSAAPVAVATAAGLHASRLDGTPLRYNRPDPWLPDLVVCRPELAPRVLALAASRVRGASGSTRP